MAGHTERAPQLFVACIRTLFMLTYTCKRLYIGSFHCKSYPMRALSFVSLPNVRQRRGTCVSVCVCWSKRVCGEIHREEKLPLIDNYLNSAERYLSSISHNVNGVAARLHMHTNSNRPSYYIISPILIMLYPVIHFHYENYSLYPFNCFLSFPAIDPHVNYL